MNVLQLLTKLNVIQNTVKWHCSGGRRGCIETFSIAIASSERKAYYLEFNTVMTAIIRWLVNPWYPCTQRTTVGMIRHTRASTELSSLSRFISVSIVVAIKWYVSSSHNIFKWPFGGPTNPTRNVISPPHTHTVCAHSKSHSYLDT